MRTMTQKQHNGMSIKLIKMNKTITELHFLHAKIANELDPWNLICLELSHQLILLCWLLNHSCWGLMTLHAKQHDTYDEFLHMNKCKVPSTRWHKWHCTLASPKPCTNVILFRTLGSWQTNFFLEFLSMPFLLMMCWCTEPPFINIIMTSNTFLHFLVQLMMLLLQEDC